MPFYILTEEMHGEGYEGKLIVLEEDTSLKKLRIRKKEIIDNRCDGSTTSKWLGYKPSDKEKLAIDLEIFQKIE